jgi:AcrR family transcriptional regulator
MSEPQERPGGRSAKVRAAVAQATLDDLLAHGYEGLSYERVASQAGVHKTTIYRRWPTKAELVMTVVDGLSRDRVKVPDTGAFEKDLAAFARAIIANLRTPEADALARVLTVAAQGSPDLKARAEAWWAMRFELAYTIVERARTRGEIPADVDAEAVVEMLVGPLYVRLFFTGRPLTRAVADRCARAAATAARQGAI